MELTTVDPWRIEYDSMNERQGGTADEDMVENVREVGVIQPPLVRPLNGNPNADYTVAVGGRRVDAAQQADLDEIPVVVVEWDDAEALESSIVENIEAFSEAVNPKDRALAIERLKDLNEWSNVDVAEQLGVSEKRIRDWLEPTRDEWVGTSLHVKKEGNEHVLEDENITVGDVGGKKMEAIRRAVGGGSHGEQIAKEVVERDLSLHDTEEIAQRVDRGQTIEEAVEEVTETKQETKQPAGDIKVSTRVVFTGDYAEALETAAKDHGASDEQIVRQAVEDWLQGREYL